MDDVFLSKLMVAIKTDFFEIPKPLKDFNDNIFLCKQGTKYMQILDLLIFLRNIFKSKFWVTTAINMYPLRGDLLYYMILRFIEFNISGYSHYGRLFFSML